MKCRCQRHEVTKKRALSLLIKPAHFERHGVLWCGDIERWPHIRLTDNYGNVMPSPVLFISIG